MTTNQPKMSKTINDAQQSITFTFRGAEGFTIGLGELSPEIVTALALHGLSQKIGDAASGEPDPALSRSLCEVVAANLRAGQWATRSSTGGKLAEALHRVSGRDMAECVSVLSGLSDAEKRALRKDATIATALLEIEQERLGKTKPTIDVRALFDGTGESSPAV